MVTARQLSPTNLPSGERLMAEAGIVAVIGLIVAMFDLIPVGDMALGARLAFWIGGFLAAWVVYGLMAQVGVAVARLLGLTQPWWGHVLAVPFSTIAVTWAVLGLSGGARAMFGAGFASVWAQALLIGAAFFALFFVIHARAYRAPHTEPLSVPAAEPMSVRTEAEPTAATPGVAASALHARLDPGFPRILALNAEDHYVRVISHGRSALVLMTLTEAAALMPEGSGAQVHRSWWVARSAVTGQQRSGRDVQLTLLGGLAAPVSRSRIADLKAQRWID
jgi:hypothetical protein